MFGTSRLCMLFLCTFCRDILLCNVICVFGFLFDFCFLGHACTCSSTISFLCVTYLSCYGSHFSHQCVLCIATFSQVLEFTM